MLRLTYYPVNLLAAPLVALNARLVEGIYSQHVAADAYCELEEIEQLTESVLILLRDIDHQVGHLTIRMGKNRAVHGTLVDKVHIFASQIVQTIKVSTGSLPMVMVALGSPQIHNSSQT